MNENIKSWSESKKWIMSILAALIIGVAGWAGNKIVDELSKQKKVVIKQVQPIDGSSFSNFPRDVLLEWKPLLKTSRYVVLVEYKSAGQWHPLPNENRFVTKTTTQNITFIGAQPGRWKVISIGENEKTIGESSWWYFNFSV